MRLVRATGYNGSMADVRIETITSADHIVPTIVLAFAADPFVRWMLPEPQLYADALWPMRRRRDLR
jgi:hypothetical protein